jgi:hypothetical protein
MFDFISIFKDRIPAFAGMTGGGLVFPNAERLPKERGFPPGKSKDFCKPDKF